MELMTGKELKAKLVKTLNLKPSQLSVTGGTCSLNVRVDAIGGEIPSLDAVQEIAREAESISRCEHTGEILAGGNRYVHCNYRKLDANTQTLLWAIFDVAVARCPVNCDYRNSYRSLGQAAVEVSKEMGVFTNLTEGDFRLLARDFASPGQGAWLSRVLK